MAEDCDIGGESNLAVNLTDQDGELIFPLPRVVSPRVGSGFYEEPSVLTLQIHTRFSRT